MIFRALDILNAGFYFKLYDTLKDLTWYQNLYCKKFNKYERNYLIFDCYTLLFNIYQVICVDKN